MVAAALTIAAAATGCDDLKPRDIPRGAVCEPGLPDVTALLQHLLDQAPREDAVVTLEPGCYRVEGTIELRGRTRFVLDGNGATFRAFDEIPADASWDERSRPHLLLAGNTDVTIRHLSIDGGVPEAHYVADAREHQAAFHLDGAVDPNVGVRLEAVRANRVWGDYVFVYGSSDVEVTGAAFGIDGDEGTVDGNGRQGVAVVDGHDVVVRDSLIFNVPRAVIDVEPNWSHDSVTGVTVTNNIAGNTRAIEGDGDFGLTFFANQGAEGTVVEDIEVSHNRLLDRRLWIQVHQSDEQLAQLAGPDTYRRRRYRFVGNTSDRLTNVGNDEYSRAVRIDGVHDVVVWGNRAPIGHETFPAFPAAFLEYRRSHTTVTVDNWLVSGTLDGVAGHEAGITGDGDGTNDFVADYHLDDAYRTQWSCELANRVGDPLAAAATPGIGTC